MDINRIPASKHIFIKDGLYELSFDVEDMPVVPQADADMHDVNGNGGDQNDENGNAGNLDGGFHEPHQNLNGANDNGGNQGGAPQGPGDVPMNTAKFATGVVFSPKLKAMFADAKREWAAASVPSAVRSTVHACTRSHFSVEVELPSSEREMEGQVKAACPRGAAVTSPRSQREFAVGDAHPAGGDAATSSAACGLQGSVEAPTGCSSSGHAHACAGGGCLEGACV
jgi:hypothetical protein